MSQFHHNFITTVINLYGLEIDDERVDTIANSWLQKYDSTWIVKAIVESLYRGRYKIKSVDNILKDWQRLGAPRCNFTPEYEREILKNLPDINSVIANSRTNLEIGQTDGETIYPDALSPVDPEPIFFNAEDLDPEESAPFQYRDSHSETLRERVYVRFQPEPNNLLDRSPVRSADTDEIPERRILSLPIAPASSIDSESSALILHPPGGKICRHIHQPVNFQLFHTLRAIVDPNNQQPLPVPISLGETVNS